MNMFLKKLKKNWKLFKNYIKLIGIAILSIIVLLEVKEWRDKHKSKLKEKADEVKKENEEVIKSSTDASNNADDVQNDVNDKVKKGKKEHDQTLDDKKDRDKNADKFFPDL